MNREKAYKIAETIGNVETAEDILPVIALVKASLEISRQDKKTGWIKSGEKFLTWLESLASGKVSPAPFRIFNKDGNSKLPFVAFSTLPGVTCPGAGDCLVNPENGKLGWCYSFRAWRYPAAFYRQCQNTLLVKMEHFDLVDDWIDSIGKGETVRLYVDGDIDSLATMAFWFRLCDERPDLQVYGYSKSWELFLQWDDSGKAFPPNYVLNISGGSKYNDAWKDRMLSLPCTRGEFIAVNIPKSKNAPIGARTNEYRKAVRDGAGKRVFVCPGLCGKCTQSTQACGSRDFQDVTIAIGTH